ncbi:hypothetical protein MUB16_04935 [Priestia sp. OVL9]|nr:hypothetical protein [Priestia sp. OVL9]
MKKGIFLALLSVIVALGVFSKTSFAEVQGIFNLSSGTKTYTATGKGKNGWSKVSYSYKRGEKIYASSNKPTKATFKSIHLYSGDTNPEKVEHLVFIE